jgi:hypothetical protein
MGYSYPAAVEYWRLEGYTDRMDADLNGIPCETVYPRSDVVAYWGDYGWDDSTFDYLDTIPSGLSAVTRRYRLQLQRGRRLLVLDGLPDHMDETSTASPARPSTAGTSPTTGASSRSCARHGGRRRRCSWR